MAGTESIPVSLGRRAFLALALVACAVRALYGYEHCLSPFFGVPLLDEKYYDGVARALLSGSDLLSRGGFRPLLYPLFLAAVYGLGGGWGIPLAVSIQHLMGVAVVCLSADVATRLFADRRAGWCTGLLLALASPLVFFEGELLGETLLTLLGVVVIACVQRALSSRGRAAVVGWICAGVVAGLAAQVRPNALVFSLLFAGMVVAALRKRRAVSGGAALALVVALCVQTAFGFLNRCQGGRYQWLTGAGGINLYAGNSRQADGMIPVQARSVSYAGDYDDSLKVFAEQEYRAAAAREGLEVSSDPAATSRYWTRRAVDEIRADPLRWVRLMLKKTWLLSWNREISNNKTFSFIQRDESRLLRWLPVRWWLLVALLPVGMWSVWRGEDKLPGMFVIGFLLLYAGTIVLFFVNGRYRIPLWPAMAILAGGGLSGGWTAIRTRPLRRWAPGLATVLVLGAVSRANLACVPAEDYSRDYFFRSKARLAHGDAAGAEQDITRSLELDPHNPDARFQSGNVRFALGQWKEAGEIYAGLLLQQPGDAGLWNNLGVVLEREGRFGDARLAYGEALRYDPSHVGARLNAAILDLRAGRVKEAATVLHPFEIQPPDRVEWYCARAAIAERNGDPGEAARLRDRARGLHADMAERVMEDLRTPIDPDAMTGKSLPLRVVEDPRHPPL